MIRLADTPILETERLILRAPEGGDFPAYATFMASERARFVGGPFSESEAWSKFGRLVGHWLIRGYGVFIICDRRDGAPLGQVGPISPPGYPEVELSWSLWSEQAEGQGIMCEAAMAVRSHVFDALNWPTIVSYVEPSNPRSAALARRLGAVIDPSAVDPQLGVAINVWRHPNPRRAA